MHAGCQNLNEVFCFQIFNVVVEAVAVGVAIDVAAAAVVNDAVWDTVDVVADVVVVDVVVVDVAVLSARSTRFKHSGFVDWASSVVSAMITITIRTFCVCMSVGARLDSMFSCASQAFFRSLGAFKEAMPIPLASKALLDDWIFFVRDYFVDVTVKDNTLA